jgi:elongator complex protein 3
VESADLLAHHERGEWRPYSEEELLAVLTACLASTPPYCRITRVIRDFSAEDIVAGSRTTNLREVAERALRREGGVCRDIRSREIREVAFRPAALELAELTYETSIGDEVFLQYATPDDRLVAFLRLSLPRAVPFPRELGGSAIIREVHVYGASLPLSRRREGTAQHLGLGRALVERACERAAAAGYADLAVISAVGTRAYYRGLGFRDGPLYQHRRLAAARPRRIANQTLRNSSA